MSDQAKQWVVRFETKDGTYTSIRVGDPKGPDNQP